jgi:hypothetical protein
MRQSKSQAIRYYMMYERIKSKKERKDLEILELRTKVTSLEA